LKGLHLDKIHNPYSETNSFCSSVEYKFQNCRLHFWGGK